MAFRQPTHAPQRPSYTNPLETQQQSTPQPPQQQLADSQEWILFSPSAASVTNTYTTSTARTRTRTEGRSRISDFGSIDTAARSYGYDDNSEAIEDEEEDGEGEDEELDSLDDNLHEFGYRTEQSAEQSGEHSGTVLPTHDGLGSFRLDQTTMGEGVQEHLYAFEQFNPRRVVKRQRESEVVGEEEERAVEVEKTRRIEEWRLEQSRVLVDEIQRETRRRKQSMSSDRRNVVMDQEQEDVATLNDVDGVEVEENVSFWNRITRRVIRDLMGIDDDLLSIIFGEALPADDDLSTTPPSKSPLEVAKTLIPVDKYHQSSWEYRLLERISRELGILVSQISDHPGAFSTYLESQHAPLPYAGLPVIPEALAQLPPSDIQPSTTSIQEPQFQPTISMPVAIPSSTSLASPDLSLEDATPRPANPLSREEWERDLDLKAVFNYLRSRFTSKFHSPSPPSTDLNSHSREQLATASTADTAARAARVRQHHPLVNNSSQNIRKRRNSIERRTWKATVPAERMGLGLRRGSSSCASERMSLNGWSPGVGLQGKSGSSRHYWDFGPGSVGSGSLIASGAGGMGSWGEV
jgi:hypothetical protein